MTWATNVPLKGKHILLTGGTGGIGRLVCQELINAGARLSLITQRNRLPFSANLIQANLAKREDLASACRTAADMKPDILVNLAGLQYFGKFEGETLEHLENGFAVNLVAPVALSKAVVPAMRSRGSGQIVNVGSIMGSIGCAHFVTYSSAKAGLKGFSEALRRELGGSGIAVTYIAPRAVGTGMLTEAVSRYARASGMAVDEPLAVARKIVSAITLRRKDVYFGLPERIYLTANALLPRLLDRAVAAGDRRGAAALLPPTPGI
ncbi:MAG: SDR family NAD(P)-dependent oxidoreductase [Aestuariivirga sp.]